MNTQHTPGPWRIGIQNYHAIITGPHGLPVARTQACHDENWEANARLIAAAPELLEALELAAKLVSTARRHFPKSIKHSDRFELELVSAQINKVMNKATSQP